MFNQSSRTPSYINSLLQCPQWHVAQHCQRPARHSSHFPAQPQTMWNVLPKFRNQILLLYGCTSVRQIKSLQIRTLYLHQEALSAIGSVNCFYLSDVYCCVLSVRHEVGRFLFTTQRLSRRARARALQPAFFALVFRKHN